ncbi:unnamed protein product [Urochloa humidicola]
MSESTADVDARAAAAATGGDAGRARSLAEGAQQQPPPAAVKGGATVSVAVVLLAVLVASVAALLVSSVPRAGDDVVGEGAVAKAMQGAGAGAGKEAPAAKPAEPVEHAVGGGGGTPGFNSRLDAFRTWARLAWMKMKLRRPRSGEPRYGDDGGEGHGAGAAKRSFEMGKETVEQAAATAARATGDAVEATKEKVKGAAEL